MKNPNELTIYRVRKSADNIKSQKGVFFMLETAIKKAFITKCNVYDNNKRCVWEYNTEAKKYEQSIQRKIQGITAIQRLFTRRT